LIFQQVKKQASIIRLFFTFTTAHAVLAHLFHQGGAANAQALCGTGNDAVGVVQGLLDQPCSRLPR
jgi:hypothetical protein